MSMSTSTLPAAFDDDLFKLPSLDSSMLGQQIANYSLAMAPFQDLLGDPITLHNRSLSEPILPHDAFMGTPPLLAEEYIPNTPTIPQVDLPLQGQPPLLQPQHYQLPFISDARCTYRWTQQQSVTSAIPHATSQDMQFGKLYVERPRKRRHSRSKSEAYQIYPCPIMTCSKMCNSKHHLEEHTRRYHMDAKIPIPKLDAGSRKRASSQAASGFHTASQYHDPESKAATELQDMQYALALQRLLKRHGRLPSVQSAKVEQAQVEQTAEAK